MSIALRDWGLIKDPFQAYYGRVPLEDLAALWEEHGNKLFSRNLRMLLPVSVVNDALASTLRSEPQNFWYFNNGITLICDSVVPLAARTGRAMNFFRCKGANIVNGAQTVGTIGTVLTNGKPVAAGEESDSASGWVLVRIISLENCPPGFDTRITTATNFQNAVGRRELAAMDPVQHRLAAEFALDQRKYVFKAGDVDPHGAEGTGIVEATQALACAQETADLAVLVKREIGELWADINEKPYTDLFNERLTSIRLWRTVSVLRHVDDELQRLRKLTSIPRADMIAIHLNRIILHLVFRDPQVRVLRNDDADSVALLTEAQAATQRTFPKVAAYLEEHHPGEYLASLCKNRRKCTALVDGVLSQVDDGPLFRAAHGASA